MRTYISFQTNREVFDQWMTQDFIPAGAQFRRSVTAPLPALTTANGDKVVMALYDEEDLIERELFLPTATDRLRFNLPVAGLMRSVL